MTDLTKFGGGTDTQTIEATAETDPYDRDNYPDCKREYPVRSADGSTIYGVVARDRERGTWAYTSPRDRAKHFFRNIGGYPIDESILDRLKNPRDSETPEVDTIYIIQKDRTDDYGPFTVFEYRVADYLDAQSINFGSHGKQRCPTLDDARAVWESKGEVMFETGEI